MNQEEQTQAVKEILELERTLAQLQYDLDRAKQESFGEAAPTPPEVPEQEHFEPEYPKVESKIRAKWIIIIPAWIVVIALTKLFPYIGQVDTFYIGIALLLAGTIPYLVYVSKAKKADVERIEKSPERKALCEQIDAETAEKQAAEDKRFEDAQKQYAEAMETFEKVTKPEWIKRQKAWISENIKKQRKLISDINECEEQLSDAYADSKLIPPQYRSIEALSSIYTTMSTSTFDVHQAIDNYERRLSRDIHEARLEEQRYHNELLEEQNVIAEKTRRDQNIAAVVNAAQQHNRNKMMKQEFESREKARKNRR